MKVGVVGLGLIGGSLLRALPGATGYDASGAVRAAAGAEGFPVVDELGALADAELVLVAVPPGATYEVAGSVLDAAPGAMVADTASVKGDVLSHERFLAAHPMAGAERAGWEASSADLLRGATWAACPAGEDLEPLVRLGVVVDGLGGRLFACTAAEHDAAVARTSHVPHVVARALAALAPAPAGALAGTAFRDMTRVAHADGALWAAILHANREAVGEALDEFSARLGELRERLGDEEALREAWNDAPAAPDPEWREEAIGAGWPELLALGALVRRLRVRDGVLHGEVAR